MNINWEDSKEPEPIIHSSGRGRRGMYYFGKVSTGFCVDLDRRLNQGTAFVGNAPTLNEAKKIAQEFDNSNEKLTS